MKILSKPLGALATTWKSQSDFKKARWKLTGVYIVILSLILNIFTFSIFFVLQRETIFHQENLNALWNQKEVIFPDNKITIIELSTPAKDSVTTQEVINLHQIFLEIIQKWILIIESALIILSGFLSYFFSGRTLRPIEEKNIKQEEFLSDVSHELKNPLSALKTSLEIGAQQKSWKQGELKEVFKDLKGEIDRLIHTTGDLLFLEQKKDKKDKKEVFLPDIIKNIEQRFTAFFKQKNIRIISDIEDFSFSSFYEDAEKVISNILHNAIKFSPLNSEIHISLTSTGKLSIQDFGIGIAKKDLPYIFDRFYKIDDSRDFKDEDGSGLGLSIIKKICETNNWKIEVKSKKKKGTIFTLQFD